MSTRVASDSSILNYKVTGGAFNGADFFQLFLIIINFLSSGKDQEFV